jgi:hypothetical protein
LVAKRFARQTKALENNQEYWKTTKQLLFPVLFFQSTT